MKIGLRTIKTGIAIGLTMLMAKLLKIEYPFFAMIAAFIAIQPTVSDSWRVGLNRMLGTFIGAAIGLVFVVLVPGNFVFGGLGMILLIYIMNKLHWNESINIAGVVFMAVFLNLSEGHVSYAIHRLQDTFLGIAVAVAVNYLIYPPTYDNKALEELKKVTKVIWSFHVRAMDRLLSLDQQTEEKSLLSEGEKTSVEKELLASDNFIQLQHKQEKLRLYEANQFHEIVLTNKLIKEVYQHLLNIEGIFEKGINSEILTLIADDVNALNKTYNDYRELDIQILSRQNRIDLQPLIDVIRKVKKQLKYSKEVHQYATDDVVKLLVVVYNLEEALSKLNIILSF
ncbi:FUSC family protein [Alkaliphilus crotonatoxidans]